MGYDLTPASRARTKGTETFRPACTEPKFAVTKPAASCAHSSFTQRAAVTTGPRCEGLHIKTPSTPRHPPHCSCHRIYCKSAMQTRLPFVVIPRGLLPG